MAITVSDKDLGIVTAYGYAVSKGYTGTEEEYAELMASYADVAEDAAESASNSEAYAIGKRNGVDVDASDSAYHNNSKYYAEQVADVAESIPPDYTELSNDVSDLKSDLKQSDNELFRVSGYLNQNYVKGRQRYVDSGVEKFVNRATWISPAQGEYIELKSGDKIIIHQNNRYHFRVCYSTDNKVTWTMTSEQVSSYTMQVDAIAWIPVIATTKATDEDVETILNDHIIEIIRDDINILGNNASAIDGIINALTINPYADFEIKAIEAGTTYIYVNTTATENGGTQRIIEIPVVKDETFKIKFDISAKTTPENFDDYYFIIREIGSDDSTVLRNVVFKLSETDVADFTVYHANTAKIIANINLKRSSETVSSGYWQEIEYAVTAIKIKEQDDIYTEAGDTWEV